MTILVIEGSEMTSWGATQAKAKFSEILDKAETSGPQRIQRRKNSFVLLTEEQYAKHRKVTPEAGKPFMSGWDALKPSSGALFDVDFPRLRSKPRIAKF